MAEKVELSLHLHDETDAAILVSDDGNFRYAVWLPLSQVDMPDNAPLNKVVQIKIPVWLATEKGLV